MRCGIHRRSTGVIGVVVGLALIAGACGTDSNVADPADTGVIDTGVIDGAAPTTPAAGQPPERIVSLSPTHTEILFAIGADDLLVAVDEFSDFPPDALDLPHGLSGFEPNVEAIASYEPDLVITGGDFTGLGEQLAQLGIGAWDGPAAVTLDETYRQIEALGSVVGHAAEAEALVTRMAADIADAVDSAPQLDGELAYYHELDPTLFSADSSTFIGSIYGLFGLQNIADGETSTGFPQLNAEYIVSANPDIIFLADTKCCEQTLETVAARPGWDAIAAVRDGNVFEMDDDIASRWGPRVVDYVQAVGAALAAATGDSG